MSINNKSTDDKELKKKNMQNLFKIINIDIENIQDIENKEISRDILLKQNVNQEYTKLIDECKEIYKSSKLTALHQNRLDKQKYPAINLLRQILKCNNYRLKPKIVSLGYSKISGKKLIKRSYIIEKLVDN